MIKKTALLSTILCISTMLSADICTAASGKVGIVIECESINKLLGDIDTLSQTLDLKLQRVKTELALAELFMSKDLAGISSNKPFQACIVIEQLNQQDKPNVKPAKKATPFALVLPLTDNGSIYLKSLGKSYSKSEKEKTLTHFSLPAGEKPPKEPDMYIGITGDKAILGPDADNVETVMASLGNMSIIKTDFANIPGTIKAAIDVSTIIPPVETMLSMTKVMMRQTPPQPAAPGMPTIANPAQILAAEGDVLLAILKQLKSYVIGIGIKGKSIEILSITAPTPGSQLAGMTKNLPAPSEKYVSAMPAGAFIAMAGSGMNILDIFIEPYSIMMCKLMEATTQKDGTKAGSQMKDIILSMKGCFSGDYAMGVVVGATPKDFAMVQMVGVNDPVKFRKTILDAFAVSSVMYSNMMTGMTLTIEKSRMSGGCEVIPYSVSYNLPTNTVPAMATAGFLKNFKAEMAFVGKDVIYTLGGGPVVTDDAITRLKTGAGAKVQTSKAFSSLYPQAPSKTVSIHSIELMRMLKAYIATVPNGEQMLQMIPDSNSGIAGYAMLRGSDIFNVTRIGLDEIAAIKNSAPAIGLLLMPLMMGGKTAQPGAPQQGGADARCINNLRMIDAAKEQCALERGLKEGATVNQLWISKYLLRGAMPACPAGGTYTLNPIGKNPACSTPGHELK